MALYKNTRNKSSRVTAYKNVAGRNVDVLIKQGIAEVPSQAHEDLLASNHNWKLVTAKELTKEAEELTVEETKPVQAQELTTDDVEGKDYRELQALAKERGIDATQKADVLREILVYGEDKSELEQE